MNFSKLTYFQQSQISEPVVPAAEEVKKKKRMGGIQPTFLPLWFCQHLKN